MIVGRTPSAGKWFHAAFTTAERIGDQAGQLSALDVIAFNSDLRADEQSLINAMDSMCHILATAPRLEGLNIMIAEWLIMKKKGAIALPFLQCFIVYMLHHGYPRSSQYMALRPYVEIQRQKGCSDREISNMLKKYRSLAVSRAVARDFDIVTEWALEKGRCHYEMLHKD